MPWYCPAQPDGSVGLFQPEKPLRQHRPRTFCVTAERADWLIRASMREGIKLRVPGVGLVDNHARTKHHSAVADRSRRSRAGAPSVELAVVDEADGLGHKSVALARKDTQPPNMARVSHSLQPAVNSPTWTNGDEA